MGNILMIISRIKGGLMLGGIGLALWKGAFAPMDWAVHFLAAISPTFRDAVYREATKGFDLMHSAARNSLNPFSNSPNITSFSMPLPS